MKMNPSFFDEKKISSLYLTDLPRVKAEAATVDVAPSALDKKRVALLLIDCQIDFCFGNLPYKGSLYVPNAEADIYRIIQFILGNFDKITTLYPTLDTHLVYQIFYSTWWQDLFGKNPDPFTIITGADLDQDKYRPLVKPLWSLDYVKALEKQANKPLCIWPEHTMQGTPGHALVPALYEILYYHAKARKSQISFQVKGDIPETEMYGVFAPEVKVPKNTHGGINTGFLSIVDKHDMTIIAGQAKSHCVLESIRQIYEFFKNQKEVLKKIWILEDCMSSVVHPSINFEAIANAEFETFKQAGMNIVKTTDNFL